MVGPLVIAQQARKVIASRPLATRADQPIQLPSHTKAARLDDLEDKVVQRDIGHRPFCKIVARMWRNSCDTRFKMTLDDCATNATFCSYLPYLLRYKTFYI